MGGRSNPSRPFYFWALRGVYCAPSMTFHRPLLLLTIVLAGAVALTFAPASLTARQGSQSSTRPPGTNYKGPAFTFNKIAEGVHHAVGTGSLVVMSNAAIIEGDSDVLVVDSHVSPGGAWALREELKAITSKPIRWVVNSHYHFDHSHGNQIYGPEVEIIGHDYTRAQMVAGKSQDSPAREFFVGGVPNAIKNLEGRLANAKTPEERAPDRESAGDSTQSPRRHERGSPDAADDDTDSDDDAASRLARDSTAVPRPRPHRRRCRRLSAEGTHRRHRRSADRRAVVHGRRVLYRVDRHD